MDKAVKILISLLIGLAILFIVKDIFDSILKEKRVEILVDNSIELDSVLTEYNYVIDSIFTDSVVPSVFVVNTTADLKEIKTKQRKNIFIRMLLSNILKANRNILEERKKLNTLINIGDINNKFIVKLVQKYSGDTANLTELLQRIDVVPPSLALAQAITESGWGTSRYAKEGNALFGHHVSKKDTGKFIQSKYSKVKLKSFYSILQSVEAYMHNINSTKTYRFLRLERRNIRLKGDKITGLKLTSHLTKYSEKGIEYVNSLNSMIRVQKLARFDFVKLNDSNRIIYISINK